jgi:molecular chaperone HscB
VRGELYRLSLNYFEIFNLPEQFDTNLKTLHERFSEIQKSVHPDRFASATKLEQQQSLLKSTKINEAYQTLKQPLLRAKYLIELHHQKDAAPLPTDFLMQQMEWEEELEDISELTALIAFEKNIEMTAQEETKRLAELIDQDKDWETAQGSLGKLKFLTALLNKASERLHVLSEN